MSSEDEAPKPAAAKPAMSRFLRTDGDSSDSESESESEEESEMSGEDAEKDQQQKRSRFLRTGSDESESEDEDVKRVVKSAKDKRLEEMEATGKVMDNALKINDWVAISNGTCCQLFLWPSVD